VAAKKVVWTKTEVLKGAAPRKKVGHHKKEIRIRQRRGIEGFERGGKNKQWGGW